MQRPNPRGAPKHAVFVDDTGRRARRSQRLYRAFVVLGVGGLSVVVISVVGGVPLPGLSRPVPLPSNEPEHARVDAAKPPSEIARPSAPGVPPAQGPSPVAVIRSVGTTAAASAPPSSTGAPRSTGNTPTRTTGNTPTRTTGATPTHTHGNPPTRTTGATPTHTHGNPPPRTTGASPTPGRRTTPPPVVHPTPTKTHPVP